MPWTGQVCPFCHTRYANKTGLRKHLLSYTGKVRVPADGIHDVLKIQGLKILKDYFPEEKISYRCPSCAIGISDLRKFKEHVFYRQHYGDDYMGTENARPPFNPELYKIHVWRPKGSFRFLDLPLVAELREMVYKCLICFEKIEFGINVQRNSVDPVRGVWLQHNPSVNLLSLLAVNHQVYHEARRVFYRFNSFVFHDKTALCVFLFGIGSHNASLLQSVKWENDNGRYENHVDMVKGCMTQCRNTAQEPEEKKKEINIWNNDDQFVEFLKIIKSTGPGEWGYTLRLLRRDSEQVSPPDYFHRYILSIRCYEGEGRKRNVRAAYELCTRTVKRDDPMWNATLCALMDEERRVRETKRRRL